MNQRFLNHIKDKNLFSSNEKLLLALSGGVDSMVLFHLLRINNFSFSVAHVNHKTRQGESDKDALFVEDICKQYGVPFHLKTLIPDETVKNFQSYARNKRYAFFNSLNHHKILTAHHSDDNLETVLLHFFTGRSTRSIPEINNNVVRPLLRFDKKEILDYAKEENIEFVEDSSNAINTYDRNFIRNKIIPELDSHFAQAKKRILNLSDQIHQNDELLNQCASELLEIDIQNNRLIINKSQLGEGKTLLLFHAIKEYGFNRNQASDINTNLEHVGIQFFSDSHQLLVDRDILIIVEKVDIVNLVKVSLKQLPVEIEFNSYRLSFSEPQGQKDKVDKNSIFCNRKKLGEVIQVRTWKDGDIFCPSGMNGHSQSLKKYFANNKFDRILKSEIPILCASNEDVVWVAGYRQDERYMCEESDSDIIQIAVSQVI